MTHTMTSSGGRVAIVTGAGSGLGEEISYAFARQGCSVSLVDIIGERLDNVKEQMLKTGISEEKILIITCDLAEESAYASIVDQTVSKFGQIDILVNNAGYTVYHAFDKLTVEAADKCYKVMLRAPLFLSQKAFPYLKKTKGCIVNIASVLKMIAIPTAMDYCAVKAGLEHLTRCLALEGAPHKIRVNAISPTLTKTGILDDCGIPDTEEFCKTAAKGIPLGRVGTVGDIASAVLYLTSDAASFVTGASLMVDGGTTLATPWSSIGEETSN